MHVHTKVTDEAGHAKQPGFKRDVLEALDTGLAAVEAMADEAIVAVTGDHATPSINGVLHTGDPTPLVIADLKMPRLTGLELVEAIEARRLPTTVVLPSRRKSIWA